MADLGYPGAHSDMWPVAAPDESFGIGADKRGVEGREVVVIWIESRQSTGSEFEPDIAFTEQSQQGLKAPISCAAVNLKHTHMIDHQRQAERGEPWRNRYQMITACKDLGMPSELRESGRKAFQGIEIHHALERLVRHMAEASAADTSLMHFHKLLLRNVGRDHRGPAQSAAAKIECVEQRPAIGSVSGRLYQHAARESDVIQHVQVSLDRQFRWQVVSLGNQRKTVERAEHVGMTVGCSCWQCSIRLPETLACEHRAAVFIRRFSYPAGQCHPAAVASLFNLGLHFADTTRMEAVARAIAARPPRPAP